MTNANPSLSDIRRQRQAIAEARAWLDEQDARLAHAEEVMAGYPQIEERLGMLLAMRTPVPTPSVVTRVFHEMPKPRSGKGRVTKKDMIMKCLEAPRPLWQTANEIRDAMSELTGEEVKMTSISPALTDLKNDGKIVRKDLLVASADRVKYEEPDFFNENGPPEGSPETGEPASSPIETQTSESVFE
jgi:hypothetical protein